MRYRVLELNQSALSQTFKRLLLKEKQYPDQYSLYSLQLTIWGLENLELKGPWRQDQSRMLEQARIMWSWKPAKVQELLTENLSSSQIRDMETEQVVTFLIENLYELRPKNPI